MQNNTYKIQDSQNIFDVLLQTTGSINGLFELIVANKDKINTVSAVLNQGDILVIPEQIEKNNHIVSNILKNKITIATGSNQELEGIGIWGIEQNFIIS